MMWRKGQVLKRRQKGEDMETNILEIKQAQGVTSDTSGACGMRDTHQYLTPACARFGDTHQYTVGASSSVAAIGSVGCQIPEWCCRRCLSCSLVHSPPMPADKKQESTLGSSHALGRDPKVSAATVDSRQKTE
eukprot:374035-Pelagomonas_calceolata.AAC.7